MLAYSLSSLQDGATPLTNEAYEKVMSHSGLSFLCAPLTGSGFQVCYFIAWSLERSPLDSLV